MTERVTVTRPRDSAPPRPSDPPADPGDAQVRALIRAQARVAFRTCAVVLAVLAGLPLLFAAFPGLSHIRVSGVRLPWLILCGAVPPLWVAIAHRHVRRAERVERAYTEPAHRE